MKKFFITSMMVMSGLFANAKSDWTLPQTGSKTYTDELYVNVAGTLTGPMQTPIVITFNGDNTVNLELDNFAMGAGDDKIYVGNIVINNVALNGDGCFQYYNFTYNGNIQLTEGTVPEDAFWMGPYLGDNQDGVIAITSAGKINNNRLYVSIQLNAAGQDVDVKFCNKAYFEALDDVNASDVNGDGSVNISDVNSVLGTMLE